MKKIAVTGANGFIGSALVREFSKRSRVLPIVRHADLGTPGAIAVGDIGPSTDWGAALQDVDAVVHCAGRAHILRETSKEPLATFRRVNRDGTVALARAASTSGVRRLIFLSSIGVMGRPSAADGLISADDPPAPLQDYAISKREAELELEKIGRETGLEIVIVRPPLVYGPNAPANFDRLLRLVHSGVPLPLGLVRAKRSFIGIRNLVGAISACVETPAAAGRSFLVSDGQDISTADLVRSIAFHMGRTAILLPMPMAALRLAAKLTGRDEDADRLLSSLRVDIESTCRVLGWSPQVSVDDELAAAVSSFQAERAAG